MKIGITPPTNTSILMTLNRLVFSWGKNVEIAYIEISHEEKDKLYKELSMYLGYEGKNLKDSFNGIELRVSK